MSAREEGADIFVMARTDALGTDILSDARLHEIGFKLVAHPFTVFGASVSAMKEALRALREGRSPKEDVSFGELRRIVGFEGYHREEERYRRDSASS